jgi:hypothetical protein
MIEQGGDVYQGFAILWNSFNKRSAINIKANG